MFETLDIFAGAASGWARVWKEHVAAVTVKLQELGATAIDDRSC